MLLTVFLKTETVDLLLTILQSIMLQPVFAFENIPESTFSHMMLEASKLAYHTDTAMY